MDLSSDRILNERMSTGRYVNNHEGRVSIGKEVQGLDTKISVREYANILIA